MSVRGLIHTFNIKRRTRGLGSYGNVDVTETTLVSNVKGRFTTLTGNADREEPGYTTLRQYRVITEPLSVTIKTGDIIEYNSEDYVIAWHKKQFNERGTYHHHSFIVEKADENG